MARAIRAQVATANALLAFNLREASPLYPFSPFNVGKRPQKYFRFLLSDSVQTSALDTLLEIKFFPKVADGKSFSGTAWLNPRTNELVQVFLSCQHCVQQPFVALFHTDSLQNIDFQLQCAYGKRAHGAAMTRGVESFALRAPLLWFSVSQWSVVHVCL